MASWSKAGAEQDLSDVTTSTIRMLDEDGQKGLLFAAIRGESQQQCTSTHLFQQISSYPHPYQHSL